ncbi:MAG: hydrogenase iron-sulfur subunit [Candidatus Thermoplasmatota archaeon]|nr:hydrogenase iron-sulfur subunit [Candidatus Thermoplasmatota archaeon]
MAVEGKKKEEKDERIGVYVCHCGSNIAGTVDCKAVSEYAQGLEGVVISRDNVYTCSEPGQNQIVEDIKKNGLTKIVVASCSPKMHEKTFRKTLEDAGINPYNLEMVNIREQCSWVHKDKNEGTKKAKDLVKGGVLRAARLESLFPKEMTMSKEVLVIGGGIAGISASLQLANSGYRVYLVEKSSSIGGRMAQLSKTFPTLDCATCILSPRMVDAGTHPNIVLYTGTEVVEFSGTPGSYKVKVRIGPKGVDPKKCIGCAKCEKVCPAKTLNEFEECLYERKAIYKPFPQAVPASYVVDFDKCNKCGVCVKVCSVHAIDLEEKEQFQEFEVGAAIVATGFDMFDVKKLHEYDTSLPDVITATQMERLMINECGAGMVLKRKADGNRVKKVAYVLCAGSRTRKVGMPYCSKICCNYAIKQSVILRKTFPYMQVYVYYIDIRAAGRGFEEFYVRSMEDYGVKYIHGKVSDIQKGTNGIMVRAEDVTLGEIIENEFDMVVLCTAMMPSKGTAELAKLMKVPLGEDGFVSEKHPKLDPVSTHRSGIFAAGVVLGPKDVRDSVIDGRSTAGQVVEFLGTGKMLVDPVKAIVADGMKCTKWKACEAICPAKAIQVDEVPRVDTFACIGCGACVSECPERVFELAHYTDSQVDSEMSGLLDAASPDLRIVGFFGDTLAYVAADSAGTARLEYPPSIRMMRVPSAARMGRREILRAFAYGADGVILSDEEGGEIAHIVEERLKGLASELDALGIGKDRVTFVPMLLPIYKVLPKHIDNFDKKIRQLGKVPPDARRKALEASAHKVNPVFGPKGTYSAGQSSHAGH